MTPAFWAILILSIAIVVGIIWRHRYIFLEELWSKLPDECEVEGCERKGVRGNENIVKGIIMCDYCNSKAMKGHPIKLKRKNNGTRTE